MEITNNDVKCVVLDGIEYVNQANASKMVGMSIPTFRKRVEAYGINQVNLPAYKKVLFRKQDILNAIERGYFTKWYK